MEGEQISLTCLTTYHGLWRPIQSWTDSHSNILPASDVSAGNVIEYTYAVSIFPVKLHTIVRQSWINIRLRLLRMCRPLVPTRIAGNSLKVNTFMEECYIYHLTQNYFTVLTSFIKITTVQDYNIVGVLLMNGS